MRVLVCGSWSWRMIAACGGTIAAYVAAGDEVTVAPMLDSLSEDVVAAGKSAADLLGAQYDPRVAESRDLLDTRPSRDSLMDAIRRAAPEAIIGPSADAGLVEDARVARLVFNAAYGACVPNYPSPDGVEAASVRAAILHMDDGTLRRPDDYVDISQYWPRKVAALETFGQVDSIPEARTAMARAEIVSRARGVQLQREFVEAFASERVWGRLRPDRLLPQT